LIKKFAFTFIFAATLQVYAQTLPKFAAECSYKGEGPFIYRLVSDGNKIFFASFLNAANLKYASGSVGKINIGEKALSFQMQKPIQPKTTDGFAFDRQTGDLIIKAVNSMGKEEYTKYLCNRLAGDKYEDVMSTIIAAYNSALETQDGVNAASAKRKAELEREENAKRNAPIKF
jgi:hypothetical protein